MLRTLFIGLFVLNAPTLWAAAYYEEDPVFHYDPQSAPQTDSLFRTPILRAIYRGDTSTALSLIPGVTRPYRPGPDWEHPLLASITMETTEVAQAFLNAGFRVETRDANLNTMAHRAARLGLVERIQWLFENGDRFVGRNAEGYSPLEVAIFWDQTHVIHKFKELGLISRANGSQLMAIAHRYAKPETRRILASILGMKPYKSKRADTTVVFDDDDDEFVGKGKGIKFD